jgi:hypothetical protein
MPKVSTKTNLVLGRYCSWDAWEVRRGRPPSLEEANLETSAAGESQGTAKIATKSSAAKPSANK